MSGKALKLIQPVSKRDQVVASFKEAILSGVIQPGEAIVESRVAQQLGAGIPLIREALIELEHQGYVQFLHGPRARLLGETNPGSGPIDPSHSGTAQGRRLIELAWSPPRPGRYGYPNYRASWVAEEFTASGPVTYGFVSQDDMTDAAYRAWRDDIAAGRASVLIADNRAGIGSGHRQRGADFDLRERDARRAEHSDYDGNGSDPLGGKKRT